MTGDLKGEPDGVPADEHVAGSSSQRGSWAVRRRALVALAVMVGLLGILAPAVAFTRPRAPVPRANSERKQRSSSKKPVALSVSVRGNRLVNARGQTVRLVGVNRSGSQYMCVLGRGIFDGPADAASIAAMKAWHINTVRVPLNEDCWLGINGLNVTYSGVAYRYAVEAYVAQLNAAGLYVILDVHWNAPGNEQASGQRDMLDASHGYALWRSIARVFKAHPAVLFDLYNEPHSLAATTGQAWRCWASGCGEYAGMSGLVTTVRSMGARNVILLSGLGWASEDSAWLKHEPKDPLHQLAATFHVYDEHTRCTAESCWTRTLLPLAAHVPLVADEFGEMKCGEPSAVAWLGQWMSYATAHGFSLLAWAWDAEKGECAQPSLITNYEGSATPYGAVVKSFYADHGLG
jgi:endoglucanase